MWSIQTSLIGSISILPSFSDAPLLSHAFAYLFTWYLLGKSQLALHWCQQQYESVPPGQNVLIWMYNAESSDSLLKSFRTLAGAFHLEWKCEKNESEMELQERLWNDIQARLKSY